MLYGLYISASGLHANEYKMAVNANNLANVNTVGFKMDQVLVEPTARAGQAAHRQASGGGRSDPPELSRLGGGVCATRSITEFVAGPAETTGQPFDIALDTGAVADGFLGVQGTDGKGRWTRDGRLTLDGSGKLVTQADGLAVLDDAGQPITIDPAGGPVAIDQAGRLQQGASEIATLRLASFDRPELLVKGGAGQFLAPASGSAKPGPFQGRVVQGQVERSAAEPTSLLAQMIQTQRAYEANANMIRYQDETLDRAVNDIGKI